MLGDLCIAIAITHAMASCSLASLITLPLLADKNS